MNGPATDSLTIRHTPRTVPGGARPGWGLPHEQLPGAAQEEVTPEIRLRQEVKMGRQQIQQRFDIQWQEINRSMDFIGVTKSQHMLRDLHTKAEQEMLAFDQKAQVQMDQLRGIDRLLGVGGINEFQAKKIKTQMMYGHQAAEAKYPEPEKVKERSTEQQFGTLYLYGRRVENVLNQFRRPKERVKKWYWGEEKETMKLGDVQIWDINAPGKLNKNTNKIEHWRNASPEEIRTRNMYLGIQEDIKKRTKELYEQPDISARATQPGAGKGGFDGGIAKTITGPITRQRPIPKPELSDPLGLFP